MLNDSYCLGHNCVIIENIHYDDAFVTLSLFLDCAASRHSIVITDWRFLPG